MTNAETARRCVALLIVALAPSLALANTGVFEGSGHTIKLVKSEDVQLRSEHVVIKPGRGPFLFNGGVPGMDRVEYWCKFVLHNRSKKAVTIQVGFPLNGDSFRPFKNGWKAEDATDLALWYKFIVREKEKTYHVRFVPYDEEKKFDTIFLWDMTFQGNEVRELNIAYEIPMAMGLSTTERNWETKYTKLWYSRLVAGISERFEYVTVTGQSWAGPIDNAKFEVRVEGFEQYLNERYVIERPPYTAEQLAEIEKERKENVARIEDAIKNGEIKGSPSELRDMVNDAAQESRFDWHIKDCLINRQVLPDGWKNVDGVITWEFKNYRPKDPIRVAYLLTLFPKNPEDVPSFVKLVLGNKPSKEDLSDLREIYLAWWGVAPKSESVRQFVSNQRWYTPKDGMTADKLTAEQKAVVSAIERCSLIKKEQ